jgi:tripartite-type tricarboxylate transporter receptor subunit TctC
MIARFLRDCACVPILALLAGPLAHAEYPDRPLKIVVPIDAGSTTDYIARTLAEQLLLPLGQSIVVENRSGAGGSIGTAFVARAAPDGYTLLVVSSAHTVNPAIHSALPYNTATDFSGISMLVTLPNVLVTSPAKGYKSMQALIDFGRAHPGELNYGSGGIGSGAHMNAELFRAMAKVNAVHVPFKGTAEVVNALIAGRVDFAFVPITTALPFLRSEKLVPLAIGASSRTPLLPDLPTTVEAGVPGSAHDEWIGLFTRAGTPPEVVRRLNREVVKALKEPAVVEKLAALGASPATDRPEEFDAFVKAALVSVAKTVKLAGIPTN